MWARSDSLQTPPLKLVHPLVDCLPKTPFKIQPHPSDLPAAALLRGPLEYVFADPGGFGDVQVDGEMGTIRMKSHEGPIASAEGAKTYLRKCCEL